MVSDFLNPKTGNLKFPAPPTLSDLEVTAVTSKFQTKMDELNSSTDSRVRLLVRLLKHGLFWSGSSLVAYLRTGESGLIELLDKKADGKPMHDIDLYVKDKKKKLTPKSTLLTREWSVDVKQYKSVDKYDISHLASGARLLIDQVDTVKHQWEPGTDIGNLNVGWDEEKKTYVMSLFHDQRAVKQAPTAALTVKNIMETPSDRPIDCFVFRSSVMPHYDKNNALIEDESLVSNDQKFRRKLHERSTRKEYNLRPVYEVRRVIKPGAGRDGYWQVQHMYAQVLDAIAAFEATFPNTEGRQYMGVFCFDQSQNHLAYAPDALIASHFNAGDGSKAKKVRAPARNGWYYDSAQKRVTQVMNLQNGQRKGAKTILQERGIDVEGKLNQCKCCKQERSRGFTGEVDPSRKDCCLQKILANQPDFLEQKCLLQELVESKGHCFLKYPKFHCELNFIEMYWGTVKMRVRRLCDYSMKSLERNVPLMLDSVPLGLIRRFARKSWRYMDAYRCGATGRLAQFINKTYTRHRRVPTSWLTEVRDAYFAKYGEHALADVRPEVSTILPKLAKPSALPPQDRFSQQECKEQPTVNPSPPPAVPTAVPELPISDLAGSDASLPSPGSPTVLAVEDSTVYTSRSRRQRPIRAPKRP
jgi:hypothetical protein